MLPGVKPWLGHPPPCGHSSDRSSGYHIYTTASADIASVWTMTMSSLDDLDHHSLDSFDNPPKNTNHPLPLYNTGVDDKITYQPCGNTHPTGAVDATCTTQLQTTSTLSEAMTMSSLHELVHHSLDSCDAPPKTSRTTTHQPSTIKVWTTLSPTSPV